MKSKIENHLWKWYIIWIIGVLGGTGTVAAQDQNEKIDNGFVFIDGKYVEAPYVVESYGLSVFINGQQIREPLIFPATNQYFFDHDPGIPPISKTTSLEETFSIREDSRNILFFAAKQWFLFSHYDFDIAYQKTIAFFRSLPNVKSFNEVPGDGWTIESYSGDKRSILIGGPEMKKMNAVWGPNGSGPPTMEEMAIKNEKIATRYRTRLKKGDCFFIFSYYQEYSYSKIKSANLIYDILSVMEKPLSKRERVDELLSIGLVPRCDSSLCVIFVDKYFTSTQLISRIERLRETLTLDYGLGVLTPATKDYDLKIQNIKKERAFASSTKNSLENGGCFSPDGTIIYGGCANTYDPAFDFPNEIQLIADKIKDQNYNTSVITFQDDTDQDDKCGTLTYDNFKSLQFGDICYWASHGDKSSQLNGLLLLFLQTKKQIQDWCGNDALIIPKEATWKSWPTGYAWTALAKSDWPTKYWNTILTQSNAMTFLSCCYSFENGWASACGGGVAFGYTKPSNTADIETNNHELLSRMTGELKNGMKRKAGEAYNDMPAHLCGFSLSPANAQITLCPSVSTSEPKDKDNVASDGTGYFMVDTYCKDNIPASEAITFVVEPPGSAVVDNVTWESSGGKSTKITYKWHSSGNTSFKVNVTVHADKFESWGAAIGGHYLDGDKIAPNGDNVEYSFSHQGSTACYILDRSGSMLGSPLANAQAAASQGIFSMNKGDEVSVVSFCGDNYITGIANVEYPLTQIQDEGQKNAVASAVNSVSAEGTTSIGQGLITAYYELQKSQSLNKNYVLLTDGMENTPPWASEGLQLILGGKSTSTSRIHTIAFGTAANQQQMAEIAQMSGGVYAYSPTQNDPLAIMNIFNTIQNEISGGQTLSKLTNSFSGNQSFVHAILIDSTISENRITLIWDKIDENIFIELITPSNQVINFNNWANFQGVNYVNGPGIKYFTLQSPETGAWQAKISSADPTCSATYAVVQTAFSTLKMNLKLNKTVCAVHEPVQIQASLFNLGDPLPDADVFVNVTMPSIKETSCIRQLQQTGPAGNQVSENIRQELDARLKYLNSTRGSASIQLFDDGKHGDEYPNDGIYGNWFQQTEVAGTYSFDILASGHFKGVPFSRLNSTNVYAEQKDYVQQTINLPKGWSGLSSNVIPFDSTLELMMSSQIASNKLQCIQSRTGLYLPDKQINQVGFWNSVQGYKIKMGMDGQLTIFGPRYETQSVTRLDKGINYLPTLSYEPVSADAIFEPLGKNLRFAYDLNTSQVYWPAGNLKTLTHLIPGKAYLTDVYNACDISFSPVKSTPSYSGGYPDQEHENLQNSLLTIVNTGIPHIISMEKDALSALKSGDILLARTVEKMNAGMMYYNNENENIPFVLFGDDPTTPEKDGFLALEQIQFVVYRESTNEYLPVKAYFDPTVPTPNIVVETGFTHDTIVAEQGSFIENGLSVITKLLVGQYSTSQSIQKSIYTYPIPSDGKVNYISLDDSDIKEIVVYDVQGRCWLKKKLADHWKSGDFDLSGFPHGLYIVKYFLEDKVEETKVALR